MTDTDTDAVRVGRAARGRWRLTVVVVVLWVEEGDRSRHSPSIEAANITMLVTMVTSRLSSTLEYSGGGGGG